MTEAYLGIVSQWGLECFLPETKQAARFLLRRTLGSSHSPAVCCWAVLQHDDANSIRGLLGDGNTAQALELLQQAAHSLGTLLPATLAETTAPASDVA